MVALSFEWKWSVIAFHSRSQSSTPSRKRVARVKTSSAAESRVSGTGQSVSPVVSKAMLFLHHHGVIDHQIGRLAHGGLGRFQHGAVAVADRVDGTLHPIRTVVDPGLRCLCLQGQHVVPDAAQGRDHAAHLGRIDQGEHGGLHRVAETVQFLALGADAGHDC
ncbi:hypothetical protein ACFFX0_09125 [Citricoccus parietis]|uniref:Uncharacterized protein n=1 Tax=Citricoccus parietis TaxID=592307 RepID=A0ABV5FXD9_9MICC